MFIQFLRKEYLKFTSLDANLFKTKFIIIFYNDFVFKDFIILCSVNPGKRACLVVNNGILF